MAYRAEPFRDDAGVKARRQHETIGFWATANATADAGTMQYGDTYRLADIRGPEGIIVALAEQLG